MTAEALNELFREWLREERFLMAEDEPIRVCDLAEFFEFCQKKSEETEMVIYADNKVLAAACRGYEVEKE